MKKVSKSGTELKYLYERNGKYLYRRPIPEHLKKIAGKNEFKESLHTDELSIALVRYAEIHTIYENVFKDLRKGNAPKSTASRTAAELASVANTYDLPYKSATEIIKNNDLEEFIKRFSVWEKEGSPKGRIFEAIFGEADVVIKLSDALEFYIDHIRDEFIGLDARTKDKKLKPKYNAINKIIEFIGDDSEILKITKQMALAYRGHLLDRMEDGEIKGNTANKYIGHVRKILRINIEQRGLNIENPFIGVRVKEEIGKRPSFSSEFIRKNWLVDDVFDGLNHQCEALLKVMINTGCGHGELCGLDPKEDIQLDHEIPHIIIRKNVFRSLKTSHRGRSIPLIGVSLSAIKGVPEGFSEYRRSGGAEAASANIMKFLKNKDLLQSTDHTVYSLRHMFKDRMRFHKFPPELQNYLMGHKDPSMGAHYGEGYSLNAINEFMEKLEWDFG